ncbi:MAG: hypothetical protein NZL96_00020 [Patescibacteria group bacterium]|nr:hypothetical protein [Patescibacteria group bacterium]
MKEKLSHFKEPEREEYLFPPGTVIYPDKKRVNCVLVDEAHALKLRRYVRGCPGFKLLQKATVRSGDDYWTLRQGDLFGAFLFSGKKIK